jgi:hypothetical protein
MRFSRVFAVVGLALGLSLQCARATAQTARQLPDQPSLEDPEDFVVANGLTAQVAAMLAHDDYEGIDRLATKYRSEKTRLPGGGWQLAYLYEGLKAPDRFHPDDQIAKLNAWIAARPQSITPRVALAGVYLKYAWAARGAGYADTVTDEGWRLFGERAAQAKRVLDDAANITPMCPEWFAKMQTVALAQNWDKDRAEELFQKAIRFEPDYLYFYKSYANYLLPKWDGDDGDAAAFAKRSADAVGGAKGDYLYYEIGMVVADAKSGANGGGLDWSRIQRGYQAQRELYVKNMNGDTNHLAFFAWRFHDRAVARQALARIGEKWSKTVWKTRKRFEQVRTWAMQDHDSAQAASAEAIL